jgi:hypothetical protein
MVLDMYTYMYTSIETSKREGKREREMHTIQTYLEVFRHHLKDVNKEEG